MSKKASSLFFGLMIALLSAGATANGVFLPIGVPVAEAPLSCSTTSYQVNAVTGSNGEFPVLSSCASGTGKCSKYEYLVTVKPGVAASLSQTFFTVTADQEIDQLLSNGSNPWVPTALGDGDSQSGYLSNTRHEYPVRFNAAQDTVEASIVVKGGSFPRISTAYMRGGKLDESCSIAGPGVEVNAFTPQTVTKDVIVVGGKCKAKLHYNSKGQVTSASDVQPTELGVSCYTGKPEKPSNMPNAKLKFLIGDQPIQDVEAPNGITFGTGTSVVFLPYGVAICTDADCPGVTYYVWVQ